MSRGIRPEAAEFEQGAGAATVSDAEAAAQGVPSEAAPEERPAEGEAAAEAHEGGLLHVIAHPVEHVVEPVVGAVASVAEPVVGAVVSVAEPVVGAVVSVAEPVVGAVGAVASASEPVVDVMGHVVRVAGRAAGRAFVSEKARRNRRLRRLNRKPLPNLYDVHPAARNATPHELGMRFVPLDEIRGTAVAGIAQRGSDFRPLPMFQGSNWEGRWKRIRRANERLETLPPIDLVKYDGGYWVLDGHNRVAAALYDNAVGLDSVVTELVPLDGRLSEAPTLAPLLAEAEELRGGLAAAIGLPFGAHPNLTGTLGQGSEASGGQPAAELPEPDPADDPAPASSGESEDATGEAGAGSRDAVAEPGPTPEPRPERFDRLAAATDVAH